MGVDILDLPNVLFLTSEGKAVVVAAKDIPLLTGAGKGVKLVNVKNGEVALVPRGAQGRAGEGDRREGQGKGASTSRTTAS